MLFLLHWLGGNAHTWDAVSDRLSARGVQCIAIDLPGFGAAAHTGGYRKTAMAEEVAATIKALRQNTGADQAKWCLAGHSMGGAIATILARRALDGEAGLENLAGLALVSPSTPGPEPMPEGTRKDMLASLGESTGSAKKDRSEAESFVDSNTGKLPLPDAVRDRAVDSVLQMNRTAFRMWLEAGSKEDWSERIGTLALPALILAGSEEKSLGPETQRKLTAPHLPQSEVYPLEGAGHLGPLERPGEVAEYFTQFLAGRCGLALKTPEAQPGPTIYDAMHSAHTSPRTLEVMTERLSKAQDWNYEPKAFNAAESRSLRSLAEAVVPEAGFDLAAALDRELSESPGDGWRFAMLPPDAEAWRKGLLSLDLAAQRLHGVPFIGLYPEQQHALLGEAAEGKLGPGLLGSLHLGAGAQAYAAEQMKSWFEDVRGEFVRLYVGDPRTMDRIGFTGFADDLGFTQIQLGQQEEFER